MVDRVIQTWVMVVHFKFPFMVFKSITSHFIWRNRIAHIGQSECFYPKSMDECVQMTWFLLHLRYKEAAVPPALWLEHSLNSFRESLLDLCQPNRVSAHPPLERSSPQNPGSPINDNHSNSSKSNAAQAASTKQILDNFNKLMSACVVLRIENFMLYRVTTSGKKQMPKEFISGMHSHRDRHFSLNLVWITFNILIE